MDAVEITKAVAAIWYRITPEEKQKYLDEGKLDKERYERELIEYRKHHPEEVVEPPPIEAPKKSKSKTSPPSNGHQLCIEPPTKSDVLKTHEEVPKAFVGLNCELPIFTEDFLSHNKAVESELKLLRKKNIDIDQENSVLMKHVENMQNGTLKVESEISAAKQQNVQLEEYLTKLKCVLASNFHSITLPALKSGASIENIEKYMQEISSVGTAPGTKNKASDIIRKMNLKFVS
jgi:high mobility group protein 20A